MTGGGVRVVWHVLHVAAIDFNPPARNLFGIMAILMEWLGIGSTIECFFWLFN